MTVHSPPLRPVLVCNIPKHIVVFVHGTWATGASWATPDSSLVQHLISCLGVDNVAIYSRDWSGRNSIRHRDLAASLLVRDLGELRTRFPTQVITVIAHSHGGNVACRALANAQLTDVDLICLSTPFLRARKRKGGSWSA